LFYSAIRETVNTKLRHLSNRGLEEETNTILGDNGKEYFWWVNIEVHELAILPKF
jgi:hypothetical protein